MIHPNEWIMSWTKKSPPLCITGDIGVGKTHLCIELASIHGYDLQQIELESVSNINAQECFSKKQLLLVDDLDAQIIIYSSALQNLKHLINTAKKPIIIVSSNDYNKNTILIIKKCITFKMNKPSFSIMNKILKSYKISSVEKKKIIRESNGDIRQALIKCNMKMSEIKDKQYDTFTIIKKIFDSKLSLNTKSILCMSDFDYICKLIYTNYLSVNAELNSHMIEDLSCIDIINTYMKENTEWELYNPISFISVARTSGLYNLQKVNPCKLSFKQWNSDFKEEAHFKLIKQIA